MPPLANAADLLETVTPESDAAKRWLTTKAAVKTALLIADTASDTLIDSLIPRASALIVTECLLARDSAGKAGSFASEGLRATWFAAHCDRGAVLTLPWRVPVTAVSSVTVDGESLPSNAFRLIATVPGRLQHLKAGSPAFWSFREIVVSFTAGFDLPGAVPPELEAGCIEQVKAMLMAAKRDPALRSVNIPDVASESYALPGGDTFTGVLLPQVVDAVSTYANPMP